MARLVSAVLCRSSSIDKQTNLPSLFELIEEFTVQQVPDNAVAGQTVIENIEFQVVSLWARSKRDKPEDAVTNYEDMF